MPSHGILIRSFFLRGGKLTQDVVRDIVHKSSQYKHLALFAGRYEGMDERILKKICGSRVISVGDFVVMGGDMTLKLFLEAYLRYVPWNWGDRESVELGFVFGTII